MIEYDRNNQQKRVVNMKILFFSDVHGITTNLPRIKELDKKENFDKIVCLGDLYYSGPSYNGNSTNSSEVLKFLMKYRED